MSLDNLHFPAEVLPVLSELQKILETTLSVNLSGIYIHGSLAMGCFKPDSSDIDVLVVVKEKISSEVREKLAKVMLPISDIFGWNVEMTVLTQEQVAHFTYPTPFEFQYSDDIKEKIQNGEANFQTENASYDTAAHFVIAKKFGLALTGIPAAEMFPEVPKSDYLDSIARDSEWSFNNLRRGGDDYSHVPKYAVLNYCRVLAFIDDGLITSKESGAEWALGHLPREYSPIIMAAQQEYQKQGSSIEVDGKLLKKFNEYAFEKIKQALK